MQHYSQKQKSGTLIKATAVPCVSKQHIITSHKNLCCPPTDERIWDAHPRVYLSIAPDQKSAQCPYCGTMYKLESSSGDQ